MIDEQYLLANPIAPDNYSDKLKNLKALMSGGGTSSEFSEYDTPELNAVFSGVDQQSQLNTALADAQGQLTGAIGVLTSSLGQIKSVSIPNKFSKISGSGPKGGIIAQLISLIMSFIPLPIRMVYVGKGLMEASTGLAVSIDGLGKSIALAGKDIWLLFITIGSLISKYFLCILSFLISTTIGCFLVHGITFCISVSLLTFPLSAYVINQSIGIDISPMIATMFESMHEMDNHLFAYTNVNLLRWPKSIEKICYTCFGKHVKMKDILADVWTIKSIGDMIAYDFSVRMPEYMKRGKPFGIAAGKSMDKASGPTEDLFKR